MSLLFEVENLAVASPATVSRCGMVYTDYKDLGWQPYVDSWLDRRTDRSSIEHLQRLFEKFVPKVLEFRRRNCKEPIPTSELNSVASLCILFDALATEANGVSSVGLPQLREWTMLSVRISSSGCMRDVA